MALEEVRASIADDARLVLVAVENAERLLMLVAVGRADTTTAGDGAGCQHRVRDFDRMRPRILEGTERFHDASGPLDATVFDFWRWAYSDLVGNGTRGLVAEYLVARVLGVTSSPRVEWDAVDLVFEGIKVEVKCAGYVQTWPQKKPSAIRFDIANKLGWDAATNTTATVAARAADVYVFCVHAHQERDTLDVLDLAQWEIYVLPRRVLDERLPAQKHASLATLVRIGAKKVPYELLAEAVRAAAR